MMTFNAKISAPLALIAGIACLSACSGVYDPTPRPDYAIRVLPTAQGGVAVAPTCPDFVSATVNPYDNQPMPQFGCASARNLAATVEKPNDLVAPRASGDMRGVVAVGAVRRYDNNQTRALIMPGTESSQIAVSTAPTTTSAMTGDVTGGAGGTSSAPAAASGTGTP